MVKFLVPDSSATVPSFVQVLFEHQPLHRHRCRSVERWECWGGRWEQRKETACWWLRQANWRREGREGDKERERQKKQRQRGWLSVNVWKTKMGRSIGREMIRVVRKERDWAGNAQFWKKKIFRVRIVLKMIPGSGVANTFLRFM